MIDGYEQSRAIIWECMCRNLAFANKFGTADVIRLQCEQADVILRLTQGECALNFFQLIATSHIITPPNKAPTGGVAAIDVMRLPVKEL